MQEYADSVIDWLYGGRGILSRRLFRETFAWLPAGYYSKDMSSRWTSRTSASASPTRLRPNTIAHADHGSASCTRPTPVTNQQDERILGIVELNAQAGSTEDAERPSPRRH